MEIIVENISIILFRRSRQFMIRTCARSGTTVNSNCRVHLLSASEMSHSMRCGAAKRSLALNTFATHKCLAICLREIGQTRWNARPSGPSSRKSHRQGPFERLPNLLAPQGTSARANHSRLSKNTTALQRAAAHRPFCCPCDDLSISVDDYCRVAWPTGRGGLSPQIGGSLDSP